MTNYVTISEIPNLEKKSASVIVKLVSLSELHSGTREGNDWTRKDAVIQDNTGTMKLTLWNEDIQKVNQVGKYYKLDSAMWQMYEGKPQLQLGKYGTVADATEADLLPSSTAQAQSAPQATKAEAPTSNMPTASEDEAISFAEKCVKSYVDACKSKDINPAEIAQGTSAVYNTALMQKMKVR